MKKLLSVMLLLLMVFTVTASVDQKPQKFEVTFKVTYNAITLEKAAELERIFKKQFSDACKVVLEVKETSTLVFAITDTLSPLYYISPGRTTLENSLTY